MEFANEEKKGEKISEAAPIAEEHEVDKADQISID